MSCAFTLWEPNNTCCRGRGQTDVAEAGKSFSHTTLRLLRVDQKNDDSTDINYWEIIADNLSGAGWSWGCVSAIDSRGRTIFAINAYCDGQRFIERADEKLTAFLELESETRGRMS
jgi:hypothetical protein